ncbi:Tfp pilus assembly protein FimT/FimU [Vulcanococcus limneticus]|uniref:pilus assembly FimT family protein n=1 Tax=Vulcanococcus limneticus TaxID=2170428 RepID=UPI00398C1A0D
MRVKPSPGFSIVELLVTVAVIGILGGIVIPTGITAYRIQRVNAVVTDLAGWLDEVRASADTNNISCRVSITSSASLRSQDIVATATAITPGTTTAASGVVCGSGNPMRLPGVGGSSTYSVATSFSNNLFYFTQRGAISTDNTAGLAKSSGTTDANLSIRISADGQPPMRCIRLTGMLGLVRLGLNNTTGATSSDCTTWGAL